jgi:hypothetical protein
MIIMIIMMIINIEQELRASTRRCPMGLHHLLLEVCC